jgi:hypothetical protein
MDSTPPSPSLADTGRTRGWKGGAGVSLFYLAGYLLLNLTNSLFRQSAGSLVLLVLLVGGLIGVLPAIGIGLVTGWSTGIGVERLHARLSVWIAGLVGLVVCVIFACSVNIIFWPEVFLLSPPHSERRWWYWFLLGISTLIYIVVGSALSVWLYQRHTRNKR